MALIGDAKPILRRLIDALATEHRSSRRAEMEERQAKMRRRLEKLAPQLAFLEAIRAELPEDGIFVDEVTQLGFAARLLLPVTRSVARRTRSTGTVSLATTSRSSWRVTSCSASEISGPEVAQISLTRSSIAGPRHIRSSGRCGTRPISSAQATAGSFASGISIKARVPLRWC